MRGASLIAGRPADALDQRHGGAVHPQSLDVERYRVHHSAERVDDVAGRQIARVTSAVDDRCPCTGRDGLRHDARLVPSVNGVACRQREEHMVAVRQELRTVRLFVGIDADELRRSASARRDLHDALSALAEQHPVAFPADPVGRIGRRERRGGSARDRNRPERAVGVERDRSTIRREHRLGDPGVAVSAWNDLHARVCPSPEDRGPPALPSRRSARRLVRSPPNGVRCRARTPARLEE